MCCVCVVWVVFKLIIRLIMLMMMKLDQGPTFFTAKVGLSNIHQTGRPDEWMDHSQTAVPTTTFDGAFCEDASRGSRILHVPKEEHEETQTSPGVKPAGTKRG